jgi:hypothetical protein
MTNEERGACLVFEKNISIGMDGTDRCKSRSSFCPLSSRKRNSNLKNSETIGCVK